jgi:UDP:flavonoid glycosyltransferase YjiC (YdhE family)
MRVLFASLASVGHTYPLVPLASAVRDAGHEVHFATGEAMHAPLTAHGLRPFRPADAFSEIYPEDLTPELARLRPDLVIAGWGVPGAIVAAHRAGIASLWHGSGRLFPEGIGFDLPTAIAEAPGRPHLDICPPSLQDRDFLATADRVPLRALPYADPGPAGPPWDGPRPVVYLTLGTVFGTAELMSAAIAALSGLAGSVLVAAGPVPPDQLGEVPGNVVVRRWFAQAHVLPYVDVVVHHGGSGTTLGALAAGVPQLVLPQGADQFANADALVAAGAALCLRPGEVSATAVAEQAQALLRDDRFRDASRTVADEIAGMPAPAEVARRLPEIARAR